MSDCPFCAVTGMDIQWGNSLAYARLDGFPVSEGHTLIIPRRHVQSLFDCSAQEQTALLDMLREVKCQLSAKFHPDGYNVGINDGPAAGQTVMHLHIHLISRYKGDKDDPRGGVRWIFPDKARYWE